MRLSKTGDREHDRTGGAPWPFVAGDGNLCPRFHLPYERNLSGRVFVMTH